MKTGSGGCLVAGAVLLSPLLGFGIWEGLQRHRFDAETARLEAALQPFHARAALLDPQGRPLPTAGGRTTPPFLGYQRMDVDAWDLRQRTWTLKAVFADAKGCWHPFRVEVHLQQERKLVLKSPERLVAVFTPEQGSLVADFERALRAAD